MTALAASPALAADPELSRGWYRVPYADGTDVKVNNDHLTHSPKTRIDLKGSGGSAPYRVVAAAAGTVRFVVDKFSENRPDMNPCHNNYVWIEHANGEWTKYSHLVHDSVSKTAGLEVGDKVQPGTFLGHEGDVGCAHGKHLHFEVAAPANPEDPIDDEGFVKGGSAANRIPRICGAKDGIFVKGQTVEASTLLPGAREVAYHGVPAAKYQALFDRVAGCGYRVDWIDGFAKGSDVFYNVVFRPNAPGHGWVSFHGLSGAQYQQRFDEWVGEKKFRPTHVDSYAVGGELRYAAVFESGSGPAFVAYHGLGTQQHQQRFDELTKDGFVPQVLSVASNGGERRFTGLYMKQSVGAFEARQALSAAQYQAAFDTNLQAGRRLMYLNAYEHGGQPNFSAIWAQQPAVTLHARHGMSSAQYQQEWQQRTGDGMTTQAVTGYVDGGSVRYAAYWTGGAAHAAAARTVELQGRNPHGHKPQGRNPHGHKPEGCNPHGRNPEGCNPHGHEPQGRNPHADTRQSDTSGPANGGALPQQRQSAAALGGSLTALGMPRTPKADTHYCCSAGHCYPAPGGHPWNCGPAPVIVWCDDKGICKPQ